MDDQYAYIERYYGKRFKAGDVVIYTSWKGDKELLTVVDQTEGHYVRCKNKKGKIGNYHPHDVDHIIMGSDNGH